MCAWSQLVVSVYFVDHVLQPAGSVPLGQWARWQLALTCALLHASPTVLSKHLQERKSWFGIAGAARKSLQAEVLLKYLQMTERSRDQVGAAGFLAVLTRDAADVVDNGFMKLYVIAALFGKIACILLYTFFYAPRALIIQLLLLGFMLHRMYTHEATATTLRLKYFKALNQMLDLAADVANHYPLIRDSRLKPLTAQTLNRIIGNVNYLRNAITAHLTRAQLALPVASAWSVGAMMVVAPYAMDVLKMTPGTFLATLAATSSMGTQLQIFFAALSDMQLSIASLLQVFTFLNTPTESAVLMLESQKQQERGRKVAEDATLQVKARKKDAKWLTKLGMGGSPPAISQASRLTTACSQSSVQSCDVTSRSTFANVATTAFNRSRSTMSEHGGERVTTGSAHVLPPTPESAVSLADAPGAPGDSSEERTADDMLIELLDVHVLGSCLNHYPTPLPYTRILLTWTIPNLHATRPNSTLQSKALLACTFPPPRSHGLLLIVSQVSRDAESTESFKQASSSRPVPVAPALSVIHGTNMQIKQGRIYGVVGHGKAQMLRLLAKVVLPTSGEVFVPPHLAVQHLEHMPMFFKRLSLYENLLIRVPPEDWPPVEQVVNVCAMLGLSYPWLNFLRVSGAVHMGARARTSSAKPSTPAQMPQDAEVAARLSLPGEQDSEAADHFASTQPWALQLSNSEKQILQLAAALIADPNLLILHHPVKVFEASQATCVRSVLRSFVAERGMGNLLRGEQGVLARTVLFSCAASDHDSLELCDGIIVVGRPAGGATLFETSMLLEMGTAESDGTQLTTKGARLSHLVTGLLPKPSSAEAQIRRQTPPSLTPSEPSESASAQHRDSASLQSDRSPAQSHLLMV